MKREQLKQIIKECMVEILNEGLNKSVVTEKVKLPSKKIINSHTPNIPTSVNNLELKKKLSKVVDYEKTPSIKDKLQSKSKKNNNILDDLIEDSIKRTSLKETQQNSFPEFCADSVNNWEKLAFSKTPSKLSEELDQNSDYDPRSEVINLLKNKQLG